MTVKMIATSETLTALGWHDVVLLPQLKNTIKGSGGLTTVLQQQQAQALVPSQAYAMGSPQVSFLFKSLASHRFSMLYFGVVMVFADCF